MSRVGAILICLLLSMVAFAQSFTKDLTDKEKALLINVIYLQNYGFQYPDAATYEQYVKIPFPQDKSVQYDYSFSYTKPNEPRLYIRHSVSREHTAATAMQTFTLDELTVRELLGEGMAISLQKNLYPYGQESSFELILDKGVPTGMIYRYRKDKLFSSLLIIGLYFEKAEEFEPFITPLIEQTLSAAGEL